MAGRLRFDEIGYWSEVKLDIIKKYASAYSTILAKQMSIRGHLYIDGFAGAGEHVSKQTGTWVKGSPLNALDVVPPFTEYHFIDLQRARTDHLRDLAGARPNVYVHEGDCNEILLTKVFPRANFSNYRRALCVLDPYGLTLDWKVLAEAGAMKSIDVWLNFPIMDMNRNAFWSNPALVDPADVARMTAFWGDDSWHDVVYREKQLGMFSDEPLKKTASNAEVAEAFRTRLRQVAGFKEVPKPMPVRNTKGAVVYYLFFASQKPVASHIVQDIFRTYGHRGEM